MKKILSWVLALVLLFNALPLTALAETTVYTKNFTILPPLAAEDQAAYRAWAAGLVKTYRESYAYVDRNNNYLKRVTPFYKMAGGGNWVQDSNVLFNRALYYPYYRLAQRKFEFNVSTDANRENFGHNVASTQYTLPTLEERQGLYLWIIKETIMEKAELAPDFFTMKVEGNKRLYSFDVKTGRLVADSQLETLEAITVADAQADALKTAVAAVDVALTTAYEWNKLQNQGAELLKNAQAQANGANKYFQEFVSKLMDNIVEQAIGFITDCLDDAIDNVNANFQNEMRNRMQQQLVRDLLYNLQDCSVNILGYLKTTYLTNPAYLLDSEFVEMVEAVIDTFEGNRFQEALYSEANSTVSDEMMRTLETNAGIQYADVLDAKEMRRLLLKTMQLNLISSIEGFLKTLVKDVSRELEKAIEDQKAWPATIKAALKELVGLLNTCLADAFERVGDAFDTWIDEFDTQPDHAAALGRSFQAAFDKTKDKLSFGDAVAEEARDAVLTIILTALGLRAFDLQGAEQQSSAPKNNQEEKDRLISIYKQLVNGQSVVNKGDSQSGAALAMLFPALSDVVQALLNTINEIVGKNALGLTVEEHEALTNLSKSLASFIGKSKKFVGTATNENGSTKELEDVIQSIASFLIDAVEFFSIADEDTISIIVNAPSEEPDMSTVVGNSIKTLLKDSDFTNALFTAIFGGTVQQALNSSIKLEMGPSLAVVGHDKTGTPIYPAKLEIIRTDLKNTLNGTIEGVVSIVGNVWDAMMNCSGALATAYNSVAANLEGTHAASLQAERARIIYVQSSKLEKMILGFTNISRKEAYARGGKADYAGFLEVFLRDSTGDAIQYAMTYEDILYEDGGTWPLTPDLQDIEVLTDYIMTQMHLDAVGMGAYLSLLEARDGSVYGNSVLYKKYFNEGVLCQENEATRRYNRIVQYCNQFENSKPAIH